MVAFCQGQIVRHLDSGKGHHHRGAAGTCSPHRSVPEARTPTRTAPPARSAEELREGDLYKGKNRNKRNKFWITACDRPRRRNLRPRFEDDQDDIGKQGRSAVRYRPQPGDLRRSFRGRAQATRRARDKNCPEITDCRPSRTWPSTRRSRAESSRPASRCRGCGSP